MAGTCEPSKISVRRSEDLTQGNSFDEYPLETASTVIHYVRYYLCAYIPTRRKHRERHSSDHCFGFRASVVR